MGTKQYLRVLISYFYIFLLAALLHILRHAKIDASITEVTKNLGAKPEGTIKTIKADHGDIIDCVNIYKQPAMKHQLIKRIQIAPSSYPKGFERDKFKSVIVQDWHRFGRCPQGTIPIRRNNLSYKYRPRRAPPASLNEKKVDFENETSPFVPEYATVEATDEPYFGAQVTINIWNPKVESEKEYSMSQLSITSYSMNYQGTSADTIAAGWTVDPGRYGDNQTRFFIYGSSDYSLSGCFNHDCPGFVQTDFNFALGSALKPSSLSGEEDSVMTITIHKDNKDSDGNWWLQKDGMVLGYWPGSTFSGLAEGASSVLWGGEIFNVRSSGHHTTTEMGSGLLPAGESVKAAVMRNLMVVNGSDLMKDPDHLSPFTSNSSCYDLYIRPEHDNNGTSFYYGGPGYSMQCQ